MAGPWERFRQQPAAPALSTGQLEAGNIDLGNRPKVRNPDGSISTVRSMSANFDGQEVLLPTVSDDGRLLSDNEAIAQYQRTGRHLGKFSSPDAATAYAEQLHRDQEALYLPKASAAPAPAPAADGPWTRFQAPAPAADFSDVAVTSSTTANLAERYAAQGINPRSDSTAGGGTLNVFGMDTGVETPQWLDRALSGAGKSVADTAQGIGQLLGNVDQATVDERRRLDAPLMDTGAGIAGNIGGQVAQVAIPVGGGARLASYAGRAAPFVSSAARGAAFAGLQPMATGQDRLTETAVGGALGAAGQGVASGLGRLAQLAKARMPEAVQESINLARAAGIPLHLSQVTNSKALKTLQSALSYLPFSGAGRAAQKQQEAFNAAVGRSFGVRDAKALTDKVMADARQAISDQYNQVFGRNTISIDPNTVRALASIEKTAFGKMQKKEAALVRQKVDEIMDEFANGPIDGAKYQNMRGDLSVEDPTINKYVKQLRSVLDSAAFRSVGQSDAALLKRLNSQWANMRMAENALRQVAGAAGNVRPAALWPLVRDGSTREMRELAKIGQNVLKDPIPDSGTPARSMVYSLLSGPAGTLGALSGGASGALAGLAAPLAAGSSLGRLMNSNVVSRLAQQGGPTSALARLASPAPRLLPVAAPAVAAPLELDIVGGTPGQPITQDELERLRAGMR